MKQDAGMFGGCHPSNQFGAFKDTQIICRLDSVQSSELSECVIDTGVCLLASGFLSVSNHGDKIKLSGLSVYQE